MDVKLVSWNEGNYSVTDSDGPRGEIHIGGDHVAAGYYNMADKTAEEFYNEDGKRWFKTGKVKFGLVSNGKSGNSIFYRIFPNF